MKVTAIILGIIGGLLFLLFALVGHSVGGLASFAGDSEAASTIKLVSWGLPILALVGAGLVTVQPIVAAVLLAVPAVALAWMFGLGFFTLVPVILLGVAALLAVMSTMESGKKAADATTTQETIPTGRTESIKPDEGIRETGSPLSVPVSQGTLMAAGIAIVAVLAAGYMFFASGESRPSTNEIASTLSDLLPRHIEVAEVNIQAMENRGSSVDPRYESRFVAKVKAAEPTYQKIGHISGPAEADVLRVVLRKGDGFEAFGRAISTLERETWRTHIVSLDFSIENRGKTFAEFSRGVIEGTRDHETAEKRFRDWEAAKFERLKVFAFDLSGSWVGNYVCGQGLTGLTLLLEATETGLSGMFEFYPVEENPNKPSGSFSVVGHFTDDGVVTIEGGKWVRRPPGYGMVGMVGRLDDRRMTLAGNVTPRGSCTTFVLEKSGGL